LLSNYGLTPAQVAAAYGSNQIYFGATPGDGRGQTIAIIDGGDDPALVNSTAANFSTSDLGVFDSTYGLNNPNFSFTVVGEDGTAASRPIAANYPNSAITSATQSGTTVTITTSTALPGISVGSTVWISGVPVSGYNGSQIVSSVDPAHNSFQYGDANGPNPDGSGLASASSGNASTNPVDPTETTTDVEWAHAMAPGAKIVLIEIPGPTGGNLDTADIAKAVSEGVPAVGATVVSMSIAEGEFAGENGSSTSSYDDGLFTLPGVAFLAATGDNGAPGDYPACSPNVLAVGATNLYVTLPVIATAVESGNTVTITTTHDCNFSPGDSVTIAGVGDAHYDGTFTIGSVLTTSSFTYTDLHYTHMMNSGGGTASIGAESGWSNPPVIGNNAGGSAGGPSAYETPQPAYQAGVVPTSMSTLGGKTYRTTPDVSMLGGSATPVYVYDSMDGTWFYVAGTSLSTPCFAGLVAIADQGRAAGRALGGTLQSLDTGATQSLQKALYGLPSSDFHDITVGNNGYAAAPGYDLVTGLGSPVANLLVADLAGQPAALTYTAPDTTAAHAIVLEQAGSSLDIYDNGTLVTSHPVASTSSVVISGGDASGTISLTIDYSGGQFAIPVSFNGGTGGGTHTLNIQNGSFSKEVETPTSANSGTIQFDGNPPISYSHVTTVDDTATVTVLATFNGTGAGDTIGLGNGGTVDAFQATQLQSGHGDFATIDFANKANATVQDAGVDTFNIDTTTATVAANLQTLTVDGSAGAGGDTFDVQATAVPTTLDGDSGNDAFNVGNVANSLDDIQGVVTVNGNAASTANSLQINDEGDPSGHTYAITGSTIDRDGAATIAYAGIESLTVNGAEGDNVFTTGGSIGNVSLVGGPNNNHYEFGTALPTSQYTIDQAPNAASNTVDFSLLPAADPPAQAADWIGPSGGATATSLCSEPDVGTVMVGAAGEQENIEYGLNIAPYLDLSGVPGEAVPGEPFTFRYVDVGTQMTRSASVNWGDGTTTNLVTALQPNGNPALLTAYSGLEGIATLGHPFATMKTYTVALTVTNTNPSVPPPASTPATATATVATVSAMVGPDPQAPGQTALFVGTSQALNSITLVQGLNGKIIVVLSSPPYSGVFSPSAGGHLYVYATTGSSTVALAPTITHNSMVYTGPGRDTILDCGSGNDRLYGGGSYNIIRAGSGNDVVYGGYGTNQLYAGRGNDVLVGLGTSNFLFGGLGRDVLIGGPGQSFLYGGVGDDLMIAGTTDFDSTDAALTAILNEWSSGNSFATRVGHLQGTIAGGTNGPILLDAATVHANGARNHLFAGLGQNWYFAHVGGAPGGDVLVKKPTDLITPL
jgi:hypothetical protein